MNKNAKMASYFIGLTLSAFFVNGVAAEAKSEETGRISNQNKVIVLPSIKDGVAKKTIGKTEYKEFLPPYWPIKKAYSVYGNEFDSYHDGIAWSSDGGLTNRYVSKCDIAVCGLAAPVHVPDKVKITGYSCTVVDNSPTHPVELVLFWTKGDGFSYSLSSCRSSTSVSGASSNIQMVNNTSCSVPVDNSKYAYGVQFHTYGGAGTSATTCENGGKDCRIYNCTINYQ